MAFMAACFFFLVNPDAFFLLLVVYLSLGLSTKVT